jgi:RNA-directed DNA polymerase
LDEVDKELEKRGHAFVRYADDCNVYVQSRRAGERVMETLRRSTRGSGCASTSPRARWRRPVERKFLGYQLLDMPQRMK